MSTEYNRDEGQHTLRKIDEQIYDSLLSSLPDCGVLMVDAAGGIKIWTDSAEQMFGHTRDEVVDKNFNMLLPVDAPFTNEKEELGHHQGGYKTEGWLQRKDSSRFWAQTTSTVLRSETGQIVGYSKVIKDLSKSTQGATDDDRNPEKIFKLLVNGIQDYAIFMLDPDGLIMTWNEGAKRMTGYTTDEIIGKHLSIFCPEADKITGHSQRELSIAKREGRYEEEGWRIRKNGTRFWASILVTAIYEDGKLVGLAKVLRDLSERKQAQEKAKEALTNEEVFRALVSGVKDYAIFMLDPEGRVMTWNEGAQRIKGYSASEIIGHHFSQFYTPDAVAIQHPQKELELAKEAGRYEEEGWRVRKDGSLFWANVVITAIYVHGNLLGFAKVTRDLTERRLAEQQREADARVLARTNEELERALQTKSRFLSTISHEVRTPMGGIIGMSELLTTQDLGEENNKIVRSVFDSSKRLLSLLNDLLDAARMDSGKLTLEYRKFPIRSVLGDVQQLIRPEATAKGLIINGTCDDAVPEYVCGDEFRLRQILLNLAFNAVKFTANGEVNIACLVKEAQGTLTKLQFSITDTGIGISASDQQRLFKPFEQAQSSISRLYGGSGLGLSISKELVELMGGTIGVDSDTGKGSRFWFEIPFDELSCPQ